jgi:chorismate dehydratase
VKLRIAAISFLNPAPLMWNFEHPPVQQELATRYEISWSTPAVCAAKLTSGQAHIGLVPIAAYTAQPSLLVIPGCTIASRNHVRSILLITRQHRDVRDIRRVALDTSSRTSATYTRILFHHLWKANPSFEPHTPDLDAMLDAADAALLIGDPALLALEDREARYQRTGETLLYIDLAQEWFRFTGTPWVSAFWTVRPEAPAESNLSPAQIIHDFQASRDAGLSHIDDLVREWSARMPVPAPTIRNYLTENIWYILDEPCIAGIQLFYRYGVECGALTYAPNLRFLG